MKNGWPTILMAPVVVLDMVTFTTTLLALVVATAMEQLQSITTHQVLVVALGVALLSTIITAIDEGLSRSSLGPGMFAT